MEQNQSKQEQIDTQSQIQMEIQKKSEETRYWQLFHINDEKKRTVKGEPQCNGGPPEFMWISAPTNQRGNFITNKKITVKLTENLGLLNERAQIIFNRLGKWFPPSTDPQFDALPVLGPYLYQNFMDDKTYFGQYKDGERHGFGTEVRVELIHDSDLFFPVILALKCEQQKPDE